MKKVIIIVVYANNGEFLSNYLGVTTMYDSESIIGDIFPVPAAFIDNLKIN